MMRKRLFWAGILATLLASAGCRSWCEHHGYCQPAPAAYAPQCCCPCAPAVGYAAAQPTFANPTPAPPPGPPCQPGCVAGR
jgi:hypothetical protein